MQARGGVTCGIDSNGCLKKYGYFANGNRVDHHPTSGIAFESYEIPGYQKAVDLVIKEHKNLPLFRLISWDISINPNGAPVLIEANLKYGELDFHQLNNGPLFGNRTNEILNEVFGIVD